MQRRRHGWTAVLVVLVAMLAVAAPAMAKGGGGGGGGGGNVFVAPIPGQVVPGNGGAGALVPAPPTPPTPSTDAPCAILTLRAGGAVITKGRSIYRVFWSLGNCSTQPENLVVHWQVNSTDVDDARNGTPWPGFDFTWPNGTTTGTLASGGQLDSSVDPVGGNVPSTVNLTATVFDADTGAQLDGETVTFGPDFSFIGDPHRA